MLTALWICETCFWSCLAGIGAALSIVTAYLQILYSFEVAEAFEIFFY
jgi:hypothetical protein